MVRKTSFLVLPSLVSVKSSCVAEGVINGTPADEAFGAAAVAPDVAGPTITLTLLSVARLVVTEEASELSDLLSFVTTFNFYH